MVSPTLRGTGMSMSSGCAAQGLNHSRGQSSAMVHGPSAGPASTAETRVARGRPLRNQNPSCWRISSAADGPAPIGMRTAMLPNRACSTSSSSPNVLRRLTATTIGSSGLPYLPLLSRSLPSIRSRSLTCPAVDATRVTSGSLSHGSSNRGR
jgi:hypothetical protein